MNEYYVKICEQNMIPLVNDKYYLTSSADNKRQTPDNPTTTVPAPYSTQATFTFSKQNVFEKANVARVLYGTNTSYIFLLN